MRFTVTRMPLNDDVLQTASSDDARISGTSDDRESRLPPLRPTTKWSLVSGAAALSGNTLPLLS